jgi:hypothetical protein
MDKNIELFEKVLHETREQAKLESARISLEERRVNHEEKRLAIEERNHALLSKISHDVELLLELYHNDLEPQITTACGRTDILVEFMRVLTNRLSNIGDQEADRLERLLRDLAGMEVNVHGGTIRDIIETQNNYETQIHSIEKAIENGDPEAAESLLNTLPKDAIDVAVASIAGPLNAAKMIAKKVGDKIVVRRK